MTKKQPVLRIVERCMILNGEKVELDLTKTDLADRSKLLMAELFTGNKYELVKGAKLTVMASGHPADDSD